MTCKLCDSEETNHENNGYQFCEKCYEIIINRAERKPITDFSSLIGTCLEIDKQFGFG